MRGIIQVDLFDASNQVVVRRLGQADGKNKPSGWREECLDKSGGRKPPVRPFTRNAFGEFIGCILLAVNYGIKVHRIWGKPEAYVIKKGINKFRNPLHIYVHRNIDLLKVHFISIVLINVRINTEIFYITLLHSFIGYFFGYLHISPLQVCGVYLKMFKGFKAFWPCSFTITTVKGIGNFWKVRGLIVGFNKSHRQIASGVVKTAYESMRAIRFPTTPKEYLSHYSYIISKPEPLGTDINNAYCSRLGTMLHLETQKGKEDTKAEKFQQKIGGTAECMKRLMMSTKGCGQLTSNNTYFSNSWFIYIKTA